MTSIRTTPVLVATIIAGTANADFAGFGNFSTFAIRQADNASAVTLGANSIRMTSINYGAQEARAIWQKTPQAFASFSASFDYQAQNADAGGYGACFVLQNDPRGIDAVGPAGSGASLGFGGIAKSVAISLEPANPSKSGLYKNGIVGGGSSAVSPVSFRSGHVMSVALSYDGSILSATITDKDAPANSYFVAYPIDLASQLGGSTAFVGLVASTGFGSGADQYFWNLQYSAVPTPGCGLLLGGGVLGTLGRRRRCTPDTAR